MNQPRPGVAFQPGDVINNTYRIEALLGRGGTSDVYKARNEVSGRLMAIKVLKAEFSTNDDYLSLLKREEEIREVRHDSVVRYSENNRTEDGRVYLLMDFVDGPGLDVKMREGPVSAEDLLTICQRVALGLQAAHSRNIVHRDLSPDNIILRAGDPAQAVIIDFGIAKDSNPGAETIVGNEFAGKYAYAAPEQLRGLTDARTDLYSLGALLLAAFRGEPPDLGANPMEIIESKALPLDTSDVPEPLKTVIDRASAPDPSDRFASALELLTFLQSNTDPEKAVSPETIIPRAAPSSTVAKPKPPETKTGADTEDDGAKGGKMAIFAGVAVAVLAAAGFGAYSTGALDSFFGPSYPPADPFRFVAAAPHEDAPIAMGFVPSEDMLTAISERMEDEGGTSDLTLASGDLGKSWEKDINQSLEWLDPLDTWQLMASGNEVTITGETTDPEIAESVRSHFADGPPGVLEGTVDVTLINLFLPASDLEPILDDLSDCGPLKLTNAPATGYGPETPITVTGRVAETATRVQLFDRLREAGEDRRVVLDLDVLNPSLCLIESHLPKAPSGNVSFEYFLGDTMEPNTSDTFLVGENPVIDVVLPANISDGFLYVSVLDVSGNVFHLLPNILAENNNVASLRGGATGPFPVRVAYPDSPDRLESQPAFVVDDSTLGKSKVVAIVSKAPLFDGLRPMIESADGFAEALQTHAAENDNAIRTLDSRLLVTQAR